MLELGSSSAAATFSLEFIGLVEEDYDLVTYANLAEQEPLAALLTWLTSAKSKIALQNLKGYNFTHTGEQRAISL